MFEKFLVQDYIIERVIFQLIIWAVAFFATMIDLWTGVDAAKARKEVIHSGGFRQSITKYLDYWRFQMMAFFVDAIASLIPQYNTPYVSLLICVAIILIECKSVIENYKSKKSNAASIPQMAKDIINCNDIEKATELINSFKG